jgi:hypothetical protein
MTRHGPRTDRTARSDRSDALRVAGKTRVLVDAACSRGRSAPGVVVGLWVGKVVRDARMVLVSVGRFGRCFARGVCGLRRGRGHRRGFVCTPRGRILRVLLDEHRRGRALPCGHCGASAGSDPAYVLDGRRWDVTRGSSSAKERPKNVLAARTFSRLDLRGTIPLGGEVWKPSDPFVGWGERRSNRRAGFVDCHACTKPRNRPSG